MHDFSTTNPAVEPRRGRASACCSLLLLKGCSEADLWPAVPSCDTVFFSPAGSRPGPMRERRRRMCRPSAAARISPQAAAATTLQWIAAVGGALHAPRRARAAPRCSVGPPPARRPWPCRAAPGGGGRGRPRGGTRRAVGSAARRQADLWTQRPRARGTPPPRSGPTAPSGRHAASAATSTRPCLGARPDRPITSVAGRGACPGRQAWRATPQLRLAPRGGDVPVRCPRDRQSKWAGASGAPRPSAPLSGHSPLRTLPHRPSRNVHRRGRSPRGGVWRPAPRVRPSRCAARPFRVRPRRRPSALQPRGVARRPPSCAAQGRGRVWRAVWTQTTRRRRPGGDGVCAAARGASDSSACWWGGRRPCRSPRAPGEVDAPLPRSRSEASRDAEAARRLGATRRHRRRRGRKKKE